MKARDSQDCQLLVADIVRELGMVIHHCQEAAGARRSKWGAQSAEEKNAAIDSAANARESLALLQARLGERTATTSVTPKGGKR